MEGPVLNGLYDQTWYNGDNLTADQYGYVLFENKILGLPRLRQLRVNKKFINFFNFYSFSFCLFKVTNDSCVVHKKFQALIPDCFGVYSSSKENRSSYGPTNDNLTTTA
jgi:polycystin 2